ncbi:hypothetical protein [Paludibacterium yongneupense]|nr:hypothetical protein [Paludibacterium yongneupense]
MASGRAAEVGKIGDRTIRFDYLGRGMKPDDCVVLPRHRIPEFVRV